MHTKKQIWMICIGIGLPVLLIAVLLVTGVGSAPDLPVTPLGYENRIFSKDRVHSIDIYIEDWDDFFQSCPQEVYSDCTVIIDGEQFDRVGIRATGNSSLSQVEELGSCRYSLKLEFDHYDTEQRYHGLDKLNLNNLIYDNTMMKDYLAYQLMTELGVAAPLCSYTKVYVNERSLGFYLAVEAIEESFLQRNYGNDYGKLYKPDADRSDLIKEPTPFTEKEPPQLSEEALEQAGSDGKHPQDVKLQYLGENPERYPNIFDNAKTPITEEDKARLIQSLKQLSTGKKLKHTVDIEAVTRYFAIHTFICNDDSYTGSTVHNYYLYEKDGKLSMLPWDYNLAFGGIPTGSVASVVNRSIYNPVSGGTYTDRPMLSWILNSKKYTWLYQRYLIVLLDLDLEKMVQQTRRMIAPYVLRDPTKFCTYAEFESGVDALLQFLELRAESVQLQLLGKPANVEVGEFNLTAMGGVGSLGQPTKNHP